MPELDPQQRQFNDAIRRYETRPGYRWFGTFVAMANVGLQALLLALAWARPVGGLRQVLSLGLAFVLADLVNGVAHLIMDHSTGYGSIVGPLVANFHLHHRTPSYRKASLAVIYFRESGSKVWLVPVQALFAVAAFTLPADAPVVPVLVHVMAYFGVLSSLAEVSHYCCHAPVTGVPVLLARVGVFLSRRHHMRHHLEDNVNYAFLNGMSDPLLNLVARRWFGGYKHATDTHYAAYAGQSADRPS